MAKKKEQKTTEEEAIDFHRLVKEKKSDYTYNKKAYKLLSEYGAQVLSEYVGEFKKESANLLSSKKTIAVVSDGSHVGGRGKVEGDSILPIIEGTALMIQKIGGVSAVPMVLKTRNAEKQIGILKNIASSFGGIVLDGISAPKCFELERELSRQTDTPIFLNNKDGLAIATLAGLINAHKLGRKNIRNSHVAVLGAGARGIGIAKILTAYGIGDVVVVDRDGIISSSRTNISGEKEILARYTNKENRNGGALEAITGADVLIGTIQTGLDLTKYIKMMAQKPIVFALAEPVPEITPNDAYAVGANIVATQNIDYPNHISSSLILPGLCRGMIENDIRTFSDEMKITIAEEVALLTKKPTEKKILPTIFDRRVPKTIVHALKK